MQKHLFIMGLLLLGISCNTEKSTLREEIDNAEMAVRNYLEAIADQNLEEMNRLTTRSFVLYEDGHIWNNDSLMKVIGWYKENFPNGKMSYTLEDFETSISGNMANTHYKNTGMFESPDTTILFNWLESGSLTKLEDEWKIDFLHSTPRKQ
jgi:hypothetical protein